jgi:hypothetical protein
MTAPDALGPLLEQLGPQWRYAGAVAVDSGAVLVIDPCYRRPEQSALDQALPYGPVPLSDAPLHTAVRCDSGLGDGIYPVVVRLAPCPLGGGGERVAELRVLFDQGPTWEVA